MQGLMGRAGGRFEGARPSRPYGRLQTPYRARMRYAMLPSSTDLIWSFVPRGARDTAAVANVSNPLCSCFAHRSRLVPLGHVCVLPWSHRSVTWGTWLTLSSGHRARDRPPKTLTFNGFDLDQIGSALRCVLTWILLSLSLFLSSVCLSLSLSLGLSLSLSLSLITPHLLFLFPFPPLSSNDLPSHPSLVMTSLFLSSSSHNYLPSVTSFSI